MRDDIESGHIKPHPNILDFICIVGPCSTRIAVNKFKITSKSPVVAAKIDSDYWQNTEYFVLPPTLSLQAGIHFLKALDGGKIEGDLLLLVEMYLYAHYLLTEELQLEIEQAILDSLKIEYIIDVFEIGELTGSRLKLAAYSFMKSQMFEFAPQLQNASYSLWSSLLSENYLVVEETTLLQQLLMWQEMNESTDEQFNILLSMIRAPLVDVNGGIGNLDEPGFKERTCGNPTPRRVRTPTSTEEFRMVCSQVIPGDIVYIRGTFYGNFNIQIDNLQIIGEAAVLKGDQVLTLEGNRNVISNVEIEYITHGVVLKGDNNTIKDVTITGHEANENSNGIVINGSENTVEKVDLHYCGMGIQICGTSNTIKNCVFTYSGIGIIMDGSKNYVSGIEINNSSRGITEQGDRNQIEHVTFHGTTEFEADSIILCLSGSNCLVSNLLANSLYEWENFICVKSESSGNLIHNIQGSGVVTVNGAHQTLVNMEVKSLILEGTDHIISSCKAKYFQDNSTNAEIRDCDITYFTLI